MWGILEHLYSQYLLRTYRVSATSLGAWNTAENKTDAMDLTSWSSQSSEEAES